jgi:prolyl-tRNA editing enzyme YbaK/EbsC (Cys-tRNA(Pro) deacylase)
MQTERESRRIGPGLGCLAKVAIAVADDRPIALIFPASRRIVLDRLGKLLGADEVRLADRGEVARIFGEGESGPPRPLSEVRGASLLMDASLLSARTLEVQSGGQKATVRLTLEDWLATASPGLGFFTEPAIGQDD